MCPNTDANQLYLSLSSFKKMQTKNRDTPNNKTSVSAESAAEQNNLRLPIKSNQLKAACSRNENRCRGAKLNPQIRSAQAGRRDSH
jgi:hypothetical protein